MAALLQIRCAIFLLSMALGSTSPPNNAHHSLTKNSTSMSMFNDINKMMAMMHKRFQRLFSLPPSPIGADWVEDRTQLDAVEPNCTTTANSPTKTRRKRLRQTQTTICTKELILNGTKQFFKEMNVTNDKGVLISHSKIYQTISINTNNDTLPMENVISYDKPVF